MQQAPPPEQAVVGDTTPTTADFLRQIQLDPKLSNYQVHHAVVAQLYRFLWSSILTQVSPSHFFPREIAPTVIHALALLERCDWSLCDAQKRASIELNERRREQLGGLSSSASSSSSSLTPNSNSTAAQNSKNIKGKFVPARLATPPPGINSSEELGAEYGIDRRGQPCGHVFRKGEAIYRCRDCALDDTCVLCAPCFNASKHEGHDIVFSVSSSSGGCCDCGDEEAWTTKICCKYHDVLDDGNEASFQGSSSDREVHTGDYPAVKIETYNSSKGKKPERKSDLFLHHINQIERTLVNVPSDVHACIVSTVSSLITYVLDTMEHAPMDMKLPQGPDAVERIKRQATLDPEDENESGLDSMGSYSFNSNLSKRAYSLVLWNDEKHSFKEVIDTVSGATEKTEHEAKNIADRVDQHGREIIDTSSEVKRLFLLAHKLGQIDLAVTVRPAYDVFAEEIAGRVLDFILDLTNAAILIPPFPFTSRVSNQRDTSMPHPYDNLVPNAAAMRALVGLALFRPWQHRKPIQRGQMDLVYFDSRNLLKLDGLLLMDNRMWKSARITCRGIYMALLGPREVKRALAFRFAQLYAKLVEIFTIHDREPDHSIRAVTVQLFSVPSIATELVSDMDLLFTMTQMLQSIFTSQTPIQGWILPPVSPTRMRTGPTSLFLRQQRCYHIFYDMRYLLSAQGVQTLLVKEPRHLFYFLDFLSIFNGVTPDRRAITEHVEFESEIWVQIFHIATNLSRSAKLFGEAFVKANASEVSRAINHILSKTLQSCSRLHLHEEGYDAIKFVSMSYMEQSFDVIDFKVESEGVSFHHPLHWLLAETLKHLHKIGNEDLSLSHHSPAIRSIVSEDVGDNGLLVVFDFPLRVIVKLAQIRGGLWVRNGFGIRSQAHHYRDTSMRDIMYDQDFYLLQASFGFISADRMLVSILVRFSLLDFFQGQPSPTSAIEPGQLLFLAEEFLLLLIHILSETSIALNWTMEHQVRREIIHFLALGQGTYSELTRHISERLKEHSTFDRVLATLSTFRAPDGTNDLGIFALKDEYFDEVQPYFFHYTRNQRENAEQVLKERQKKKNGVAFTDKFVPIPTRVLQSGQSVLVDSLREVLASPVLLQIVYFALYNAAYMITSTADGLVDGALQLLMLGLVEKGETFSEQMAILRINNYTLIKLLLTLQKDKEKLTSFKPKIEWITTTCANLNEQCRQAVLEMTGAVQENDGRPAQESIEDRKKAAAKARQAAIMQQFSAQQKNLLEMFEAEGEEEEEDEIEDVDDMDTDASMGYAKENGEGESLRHLGTCIFCQELLDHNKAFGSLAHIQSSRLMRTTPRHDVFSLQQSLHTPLTLDRSDGSGKRIRGDLSSSTSSSFKGKWNGFPAEDRRFGFYASTCGHLMHLGCFENYCRSIEHRHAQQIARNHPEDLSRLEYVCPLCKSLGNVILPVPRSNLQPSIHSIAIDRTPLSDWIRKINIDILKTSTMQQTTQMQEAEHGTGSFTPWYAEDAQIILEASVNDPNRASLSAAIPTATRQMLERLIRVLRPLSTKSRSMRLHYQSRSIHAPPSRKLYIPEEVIAYTIGVLEIAQRGMTPIPKDELREGETLSEPLHVADGVSIHTRELVQSLIYSLRDIARLENEKHQSVMRHGLLMRLLPHWGGHEPVRSPLLLRDPLTVLVEAAIIAPENLPQITTLMFYVQLVQVVFGLAQPSIWPQNSSSHLFRGGAAASVNSSNTSNTNSNNWKTSIPAISTALPLDGEAFTKSDSSVLEACFDDVRATVGNIIGLVGYTRGNITLGVDNVDDQSLAKIICTYCLPFLRRATILQKSVGVLSEVASKDKSSNVDATMSEELNEKGEFLRLMQLLEIPLPKEALPVQSIRQTALASLVEGWIKHAYPQLAQIFRPLPIQPSPLSASSTSSTSTSSSKNATSGGHHHHHPTLQLEHPHIYELIQLPTDLTKLLMQCQVSKCKECGNLPPEPAICLECGELVCFQSFCCQGIGGGGGMEGGKGECNRHVDECGYSSGLFFKVKSNIIILLYQGNGCFTFSPYLDTHGEVDIGLKKGKIQYLHLIRFDELRKQWLHHGLANTITRKIEAVIDQGGWITM